MMYKDGFAFAVKYSGGPLSEFKQNGETVVFLPFGSEFQLFLKNTTGKRAIAEVLINGVEAIEGGLVVNSKSAVVLDCFQPSQKRFKFLKEGCRGDYASGDRDNGVIEINFRSEVEEGKIVEHHHHYHHYGYNFQCDDRIKVRWDDVWCGASSSFGGYSNSSDSINTVGAAYHSNVDSGVVVGGSKSGQEMVSVSGFLVEDEVTSFCLKLVGKIREKKVSKVITSELIRNRRCSACDRKLSKKGSFCPYCAEPVAELIS